LTVILTKFIRLIDFMQEDLILLNFLSESKEDIITPKLGGSNSPEIIV